jgi:hypothetical protein
VPRRPRPPAGNPDDVPLGRPDGHASPRPSGGGFPPPQAPNDDAVPIIPDVVSPEDEQAREKKDHARAALAELVVRKREALKLYHPLAECEEFHQSKALIRLILGGNRSGKTTASVSEVARAVTGQDPWGKWPHKDGNFIVVGKDGSHIGKVMYPRLFRSRRNFLTIRDRATGLWRAWKADDMDDQLRKDEARPAGPIIPSRFVIETSWYSKKDSIPRIVKLVNGWEMYFYSSESDPPGGYPADGAWFDEEILRGQEWTEEVMARLVDRQGRFIWSATPQNATEELFNLHSQAQEEAGWDNPGVKEWTLHIDGNVHLPTEAKEKFKDRMRKRGEEAYQVRVEGKFAIEGYRVYPEYGDQHRVKRFKIPDEWTLWVITDPGRQVCGVLFLAIPDPQADKEHRGHVYACEELYIRNADARQFGRGMKTKLAGRMPRGYIIDEQEGRKHDTGSGRSIQTQYSQALRRRRLSSIDTGFSFVPGAPDPKANREAVRDWLTPDDSGFVKLRVFDDLANIDREMKNYHFKRVGGYLTDDPVKKNDHLCDCLGYGAAANLRWRKPPALRKREDLAVIRSFLKKRRERNERTKGNRRNYTNLGPTE